MDLTIRTDPRALGDLADEWVDLWQRDPGATLFQRPEYVEQCCAEFGEVVGLLCVEMRRDGRLDGLATAVIGAGYLALLGDPEVTDYLGPVSAPEDRDAVADGFIAAAAQTDGWHTAELVGLAADSGWAESLARAAKAHGFAVEERQQDVCPRVHIPGSFDDYLASLDGKLRHEIRRKGRKLAREAGEYTIRLSTAETLEDDLERFYDFHRASDGPKGHFLHAGMTSFFTRLARSFLERGWLRLSWLDIGGESWAGIFSFAERGVWSVYNSAFDHSKRELAPGMVLMAESIRLAAEEGATTFDLLRGSETYKYRFGAVDVPLMQLTVRRG